MFPELTGRLLRDKSGGRLDLLSFLPPTFLLPEVKRAWLEGKKATLDHRGPLGRKPLAKDNGEER